MQPTILHVEDDTALAEVVQLAFDGFGFRGTMLHAETVAEAAATLDDRARRGGAIDLIISDMSLPDGSGLDVVRGVRRNPVWKHTPVLILSADVDPGRVGRAYALGANCYVAKSPRTRAISDVVRTLYDHWVKDVQLPPLTAVDRTCQFLATAVDLRGRHAAFYMQMANQFGDDPSEVAFWLTRALSESNLTNLITFLQKQFDGDALPTEMLDEIEQAQADSARGLAAIERAIEFRPITTHEDAYLRMLELVSIFKVQPYVRSLGHLFPIQPAATAALVDFIAMNFDEVAGWIETHTTHATLREGSARLRADALLLRCLPR